MQSSHSRQRGTAFCNANAPVGGTPGPTGECGNCRKKRLSLQRKTRNSELETRTDSPVPPIIHEVLRSPSQPLDPATRAFMEPRFGHDFSQVRLHADTRAADSAKAINALAYTVGRHVVFGAPQPVSAANVESQRLLAHELTHVVQQGYRDVSSIGRLQLGSVGSIYESEADAVAGEFAGQPAGTGVGRPVLQQSDQPMVMRTPLFASTIDIQHNYLRSRQFHVSQGGLVVTVNATWEASEWQGSERPECGPNQFAIELRSVGSFFDSPYGTCEFAMGRPVSHQWTNLPQDDYYLGINAYDHRPICSLVGDIEVSQERGLTGESCTEPPPGPLEILHAALAGAGMIPALGVIPDGIDAGIYVIQGDWTNAGISAVAMVPVFGDAARAVNIGTRAVLKVEGRAAVRLGRDGIATGIREARAARRAGAVAAETVQAIRFQRSGVRFSLRGAARQFEALDAAGAGAQVYVIRDARRRVIYVGYTERGSVQRLGEHLTQKAGDFIGEASQIEVKGADLLEREARALEEDLIRENRPRWNTELNPYTSKYGAPPNPEEVRRAQNTSILFDILIGD